ncbi:signal peptide peptidase SppA [Candidatus Dependentiae bacterium]|nr:signal peptide peptidase SppA [Candidatus Dependentiae bacterium]
MDNQNNSLKKSGGFFNLIKNLFILLLFLQFAPSILMNIKKYFQELIIPRTKVAKLNIKGIINSSTFYIKKMEKFLNDNEIKALLINVDSPGGLPGSSQAIFNAIKTFKKEKPVVIFSENVCASGAYYFAAAADYIITSPSAMIGSIGVLAQIPNIKGLLYDWKIKFENIQSGKYKTAGSPIQDLNKYEEEYLQEISDQAYKQFINDVAQSRNLNSDDYKKWADGKIFLGTEALKLKLIDQIGGFQDAVKKIKELAKIETEIKFVRPKTISGLAKLFYGEDEENSDISYSSKIANFLSEVYFKFNQKQNNIMIS